MNQNLIILILDFQIKHTCCPESFEINYTKMPSTLHHSVASASLRHKSQLQQDCCGVLLLILEGKNVVNSTSRVFEVPEKTINLITLECWCEISHKI